MELLGNERVRSRLAEMAQADRLHPCLLFEGPEGIGKGATAVWLAQLCNCEREDPSERPCGSCRACIQIPKGTHPDVILVGTDPERTSRIISVRQARELSQSLTLRPYSARHRFVILDPADAMGPEAANALLKSFEEPPEDTGFILVCSRASSLLATVRSRSQRIRFAPVATAELEAWLRARGVEDATHLATLADGRPGRALELAQGEAEKSRAVRDAVLEALQDGTEGRLKFTEKLAKGGDRASTTAKVERLLEALSVLVVDALRCHAGAPEAQWQNADRPEVVRAWAGVLGPTGAARLGQAIRRAEADLAAFVNTRLLLDALLATVVAELGIRPGRR